MERASFTQAIGDDPRSFRELLDATPDAMVLVDTAGSIVFANKAMSDISGLAPDRLAGISVEDLVPEELRGLHEKQRKAFNESPERRPLGSGRDLRLRRADGGLVTVDVALSPVVVHGERLVLASLREVRAPLEVESRRVEGEAQFLSMFEKSSLALVITDARHRISALNAAMERFLGHAESELVGRELPSYVHPDDLADVSSRMTRLVDGRISTFQAEVRFLARGGRERTGNLTAAAIFDETRPAAGSVHIIEDITTRRKLERRLEAQASQARETLSALSQRETEVLDLYVDGLSARQIGVRLFLSVRTVESHLASAYKKLAVNGKTDATSRFLRLRHIAATNPKALSHADLPRGRGTT
jgi:PAS domain S-box-containing protein